MVLLVIGPSKRWELEPWIRACLRWNQDFLFFATVLVVMALEKPSGAFGFWLALTHCLLKVNVDGSIFEWTQWSDVEGDP